MTDVVSAHLRRVEQSRSPAMLAPTRAELRHCIGHRPLFRHGRKQRMLKFRQQRPENRRAEQDTSDQLAQYRWLPDPLHRLAQQPATEQQGDDLRYENRDRRTVHASAGGER
jgi:hypothetical protein